MKNVLPKHMATSEDINVSLYLLEAVENELSFLKPVHEKGQFHMVKNTFQVL